MPAFRRARVTAIRSERQGLQRVDTTLGRAYVLTELTGSVAVDDDVIVNTTAVDLDLGTGGWHFVHWNLSRQEFVAPGPGHIIKLRYTSLQTDTGSVEETGSPLADDLGGVPVVVCSLHSQVAVVIATLHHLCPSARLAYVMTDGAGLPLVLSDLVAQLVERGAIDRTITAGHAFGGEFETVSVPSALAAAVGDGADVIVVGMGPGVVGTESALGTTALEAADIVRAASVLGGRAILCVRASSGDPRPRHHGVSHHVRTILRLLEQPPAMAVPPELDGKIEGAEAVDGPDPATVLGELDLNVTTMGRSIDEDPLFFRTAVAAGVAAARLLSP